MSPTYTKWSPIIAPADPKQYKTLKKCAIVQVTANRHVHHSVLLVDPFLGKGGLNNFSKEPLTTIGFTTGTSTGLRICGIIGFPSSSAKRGEREGLEEGFGIEGAVLADAVEVDFCFLGGGAAEVGFGRILLLG